MQNTFANTTQVKNGKKVKYAAFYLIQAQTCALITKSLFNQLENLMKYTILGRLTINWSNITDFNIVLPIVVSTNKVKLICLLILIIKLVGKYFYWIYSQNTNFNILFLAAKKLYTN